MSLGVNQSGKMEKQLVHWSIVRYNEVNTELITLRVSEDNQMVRDAGAKESKSLIVINKDRDAEKIDCMS